MAGWSMVNGASSVDSAKTPKKLEPGGCLVDLEPVPESYGLEVESEYGEARRLFNKFLVCFLKEFCPEDSYRPGSPMVENGQFVDLHKLFMVVREKGGYEAVSRNMLWDSVAEEFGLGVDVGSAVKLVYVKYLDSFERWLKIIADNTDRGLSNSLIDFSRLPMKLNSEVKGLMPEISAPEMVDDVRRQLDRSFSDVVDLSDAEEVKNIVVELGQTMKVDHNGVIHLDSAEKMLNVTPYEELNNFHKTIKELEDLGVCTMSVDQTEDMHQSSAQILEQSPDLGDICVLNKNFEKQNREDVRDDMDDVKIIDLGSVDKDSFCRKRKRGSLWEVVNWITGIAKNPCDPVVGLMPEKLKWKSMGNEEMWKQVLLFREVLFMKRHVETSAEQLTWQNQKMHPCLYEDSAGSMYNLRERLRCDKQILTSAKRDSSEPLSGSQSDVDKTSKNVAEGAEDNADKYDHKLTPLGPTFQAEVPEWTSDTAESDSKWLGTKVWPLEKVNNRYLIERDPMGKGRQDSCGCPVPGSIECVRFHVSEKRSKLKQELGSAFYAWDLHNVGEEVKLCWTEEEKTRFNNVVTSNASGVNSFWDKMFKEFRTKNREHLVSYYFNVFLLQRRANQNRHTLKNIDSDDDETECGLRNVFGHQPQKSGKSILISPKKTQTKLR